MLHIEDITFTTITAGLFDGQGALIVELGPAFEISPSALILSVENFLKTYGLQSAHIRLVGDIYHQQEEELTALTAALSERGYATSALLDGTRYAPWMDKLTYRIVVIDDSPWLGYNAAELRYVPKGSLSRPQTLPKDCPFKYVVANNDVASQDLLQFVLKNPDFRIYSRPLKTFKMKVPLELEG